jgi:hypothetical protein
MRMKGIAINDPTKKTRDKTVNITSVSVETYC